MISVDEAYSRILSAFGTLPAEQVMLSGGLGRVLAAPAPARVDHPWSALSAMDGYAVRGVDVADGPSTLTMIGSVPAGSAFDGAIGPGDCVRIFTGAPLPAGADTIVIQEDTRTDGETIHVTVATPPGRYVRPRGMDFAQGQSLLPVDRPLTARHIALAAAMNIPWLTVRRRPRVAILSTGDEITHPGDPIGPNQLPSANGPGLAALVTACGGHPISLGIAADDRDALVHMAEGARGADLLLTTGGASVGDHDLVRDALGDVGLSLDFWKIAMRPGKPLMFGTIGNTPLIGLPGNPVSTMVCGLLFIRPVLRRMLGIAPRPSVWPRARLGCDLPANDRREDYLRASLSSAPDDTLPIATPFEKQDSSMIAVLAASDALVIRAPHAAAASAGDVVSYVPFPDGPGGL